jgi:hypothetical protein
LEARRLRAAELFCAGVRQAEVDRQLEVSAQAPRGQRDQDALDQWARSAGR